MLFAREENRGVNHASVNHLQCNEVVFERVSRECIWKHQSMNRKRKIEEEDRTEEGEEKGREGRYSFGGDKLEDVRLHVSQISCNALKGVFSDSAEPCEVVYNWIVWYYKFV